MGPCMRIGGISSFLFSDLHILHSKTGFETHHWEFGHGRIGKKTSHSGFGWSTNLHLTYYDGGVMYETVACQPFWSDKVARHMGRGMLIVSIYNLR